MVIVKNGYKNQRESTQNYPYRILIEREINSTSNFKKNILNINNFRKKLLKFEHELQQ